MAIIFCRTVIVFVTLLALMRIMGKRQLGQLEISELVVSVLIADMSCLALQDIGIPFLNSLVPILTIFCLELLLSGMTLRSVRLRALVWGKPCFLIRKGQIDQREMKKNRFSPEELTEELRRQGITDINTVEYAVLETDGTLNVMLIPPMRPATAAQLGAEAPSVGYSYIVISQGRVLGQNLHHCGRDRQWLEKELRRQGARNPSDVYLMMVNGAGQVYFSAREESK